MQTRWIVQCGVGEALGIAGVAVAYAASSRGLVPAAPAILTGGAWEGLCLGTAQALVLRRAGIAPVRWIAVTTVIAVLGYAGSLAGGAGAGDPAAPDPPLALLMVGAFALGLAMGVLMGAVQTWAARGRLPAAAWIIRNALGWGLAMCAIFAGSAVVSDGWSLGAVAWVGALSGAVAGALLGLVTAPAVPR